MNGGLGGEISLLELFRMEAETHCAALGDGLLALEKSPGDRSIVEPLMRAAHSIKGAARIVGLDAVVSLAHVMEERFLSARDGREALTRGRIDQLLEGVDLLGELRQVGEQELPAWTQAQAGRIAGLAARLKAPPPAASAPPAPQAPPAPPAPVPPPAAAPVAPAAPAAPAPAGVAGNVRVAAEVLNRMLFLAGESTVEASRLQSLRELLAGLKARARTLDNAVGSLRDALRGAAPGGAEASEGPVGALAGAAGGLQAAIDDQSARFDGAFRRVEELTGALYTEVLRSRLRPFAEGITAFPRMVRDIAHQLGKTVDLRVEGEHVEVDRDILQKLESPLTHMVRNSLDHGVETPEERRAAGKPPAATITLSARHQSGMLAIEVRDDGRGIDPESIRRKVVERGMVDAGTAERLTRAELMEFLFLPGFSTRQAVSELSGRGVGLDVVRTMVQEVSGSVTLDSEPGRGARFTLRLPVTRSVIRAALVQIGGQLFAVPLARLERVLLVPQAEVEPVQGRMQCMLEERPLGLIHAAQVLAGEQASPIGDPAAVLVIGSGDDRCGLIVDAVCGEEDLVVRPLDPRLGAVPHIAAAAIRSDGVPVLVVHVDDLWRSVKQSLQGGRMLGVGSLQAEARQARRRILVVDDSITVREVERQLLIRRGYDVDVAVDGREGYNALRAGRYDLMITDVDMPRMNGIELIRSVRREPRLADLPIIIVSYKDREEDRLQGMEAGASAYLTKSSFQDDSLVRMVGDLIGGAGLMRIGIVNDLRLAVEALRRAVAVIPGAAVAWVAENGAEAVACCARDRPDIVLMDMIMPVMDGVEATRRIMQASPCPILVVTATVEGNAARVFEALGAGAMDAVATPRLGHDGSVIEGDPLVRKIRTIGLLSGAVAPAAPPPAPAPLRPGRGAAIASFAAIGASTGGPEALATVLRAVPRPAPWPIVIVQHVDPAFAPGLADWLSRGTGHRVEIIQGGESPAPGRVLLAATVDHLVMDRAGRLWYAHEPAGQVYRPSVDVFFDSVALSGAAPGVAAVLTGMGRDGAAGLARLRNAGWHTIAQDEATSVVWGMPGAAVQLGAAREVLAIGAVGSAIAARMMALAAGTARTA